jgi:hypothetical protein
MKTIILTILVTFLSASQVIGQNIDKAKSLYFMAEYSYNNKNYDEALSFLEQSVTAGGGTIDVIEALRIKIYHDQKKWIKAKETLDLLYKLKPDNETLRDLAPFIINIEKEFTKAKAEEDARIAKIKAENEARRKEEEQELRRKTEDDKFFKAKAIELKPIFEKQLNDFDSIRFSSLPTGKAPVLQLKTSMGISNNSTEKSYLLVDRDNFLIITIPSVNALTMLDLEKVSYSSYDAGKYSNNVVHYSDVKTSFGKRDLKFRQSDRFNNVYIGGLGNELLWTGEQYTQFEKTLYYYVVNNGLRADINMFPGGEVLATYQNPYIENGLLSKTIDYRLVTDENLRKRLERLGFKDVPSRDRNNLNLLKIEAKSSGKTNMILSCNNIKYQMDSKISGKFTLNNQNFKGEHLYFRPASSNKIYGRKTVSTSKERKINILEDTHFTDKKQIMMIFDTAKTALGAEKELGGLYTWSNVTIKWMNFFTTISSANIAEWPY